MRTRHLVWTVVVMGLLVVPAESAGSDRGRLSSVIARCDRLDGGAADIVRTVERSDDFDRSRDNPLIADLTAFRAYVRSLREVAEQARSERIRRLPLMRYRTTLAAMQRLTLRLRMTAANVESEIARERSDLSDAWSRLIRDNLDDVVTTVLSMRVLRRPEPLPDTGRPPAGFVPILKRETYKPAGLKGLSRSLKIEAYGGKVKVRIVKFTITEASFGYFTFDQARAMRVNREVVPGRALLVQVERGHRVDVSKIEVEWEPDAARRCFGRVTVTDE